MVKKKEMLHDSYRACALSEIRRHFFRERKSQSVWISLSLSLSLHRMATSLVSFNDQRCAQVGGLYRFLGGKRRGFPLPPRICASPPPRFSRPSRPFVHLSLPPPAQRCAANRQCRGSEEGRSGEERRGVGRKGQMKRWQVKKNQFRVGVDLVETANIKTLKPSKRFFEEDSLLLLLFREREVRR